MATITEEKFVSVRTGVATQATGGRVTIYMDQWCVQLRCMLKSGAANLAVGTQYTLVRENGASLADMYCDELPAALAPMQFSTTEGWARFSNRRLANGNNNTYKPTVWQIGKTPLGQAPVVARVDRSKLSFNVDDL